MLEKKKLLLAELQHFLTESRKNLIDFVVANRTNFVSAVIHDVYQEHNSGAIMRNCDVFGIHQVHVIEENYRNRLVKSISKGSSKWLEVNNYQTAIECLSVLKNKGFKLVATVPDQQAMSINNLPLHEPLAILLGAEKKGLPIESINKADYHITLPMYGFSESLNVGVASGIIFKLLMERLKAETNHWQLTEQELIDCKIDFTRKSLGRNADSLFAFFSQKHRL